MRGEIYNIENKKILAFGGGLNDNNPNEEQYCLESVYPDKQQIDNVIDNIKKVNGEIDLIVTHEAPNSIKSCLSNNQNQHNTFTNILEEIRLHSNFKKWFFGKYHIDKVIPPKEYESATVPVALATSLTSLLCTNPAETFTVSTSV